MTLNILLFLSSTCGLAEELETGKSKPAAATSACGSVSCFILLLKTTLLYANYMQINPHVVLLEIRKKIVFVVTEFQ